MTDILLRVTRGKGAAGLPAKRKPTDNHAKSASIVCESHHRNQIASVTPGKIHYVDITTAEAANYSLTGMIYVSLL